MNEVRARLNEGSNLLGPERLHRIAKSSMSKRLNFQTKSLRAHAIHATGY